MSTEDWIGIKEELEATEVRTDVASIPARGEYTEAARAERLRFIRRESGAVLGSLEQLSLLPRRLTGNIENLVGAVEIPVGIAGPLLFDGEEIEGVGYAPLATTEGTLVASASRGARALSRAGGVKTRVLGQRMSRAPLFVFSELSGASRFVRWIEEHGDEFQGVISQVSRHAKLVELKPVVLGRQIHLVFIYETGDAAGQNMTTSCTWHACQWLLGQLEKVEGVEIENFVVEANMSSDKKVSYQSFSNGRGIRVVAESRLSEEVLKDVLKVSRGQLMRTYHSFVAGSIQGGMVGFNINVANIIAAVFTATGQDIGCVHESSLGQFFLEEDGQEVVASLVLPGLIVGTVGGGTQLPNQRDYLAMMGCGGAGKVRRLAEMICGFALALDLSTLSAIAAGHFARAHERLGRNRPVEWLQKEELDEIFFELGLRRSGDGEDVRVLAAVEQKSGELGSSIVTELTARKVRKLVGHFPYRLRVQRGSGEEELSVIAKVKPLDEEVILMLNSMASMCGPAVAASFGRHRGRLEFSGSDEREVAIYESKDERLRRHMPRVYGTFRDRDREAYVVVLEDLRGALHLDSADDVSGWKEEHLLAVLEGLGEIHSVWYGATEELEAKAWIGNVETTASIVEKEDLWRALADHGRQEFSGWISEEYREGTQVLIDEMSQWWRELESMPKTLVHNDFNPRNLCLRGEKGSYRLCAYDWELATVGVPQRDLAEFLCFLLPADVDSAVVERYVEVHRQALERAAGVEIDRKEWWRGFELSLLDLRVRRFGLYLMAHTFRHYGFMERTVGTLERLSDRVVVGE